MFHRVKKRLLIKRQKYSTESVNTEKEVDKNWGYLITRLSGSIYTFTHTLNPYSSNFNHFIT